MPRCRTMTVSLLLCALPLIGCAPTGIQLPPRIEKQRLAAELVRPCGSSTDGLPDQATPRLAAQFLLVLQQRLDRCNWKLERIGQEVEIE